MTKEKINVLTAVPLHNSKTELSKANNAFFSSLAFAFKLFFDLHLPSLKVVAK